MEIQKQQHKQWQSPDGTNDGDPHFNKRPWIEQIAEQNKCN